MNSHCLKHCNYCQSAIDAGQRWARQKIHNPDSTGRDRSYRHYHAQTFVGQQGSVGEFIKRNGNC